ncbi:MAG: hypothetical protein IPG97_02005 [Microthrixaceae bacterium]|nr:hypothetical protein [Microthrixaceae bacterium]
MTNANTAEETNQNPAPSGSAPAPASASARLEAGVQALTVPEPLAEAETLLLKSGAVLPVIGLVLMIAAWWSASDTPYVADQIPMLISGGLVGLGLLLVGLGLFLRYSLTRLFRFWLARVIVEQQTQNERVLAALDGIETAIRESRLNR